MADYIYPAVFEAEDNGGFSIYFPDIENCYTCAENYADGLSAAEDVLSLMLYELRKEGEDIPEPSTKEETLENYPDSKVVMIEGDPDFYERYFAEYHPEVS